MQIGIMRPDTYEEHQYGVAIPTNGPLMIIQTYQSLKELNKHYDSFYQFAKSKNITIPLPIEKIPNSNKVKILENIIQASKNKLN